MRGGDKRARNVEPWETLTPAQREELTSIALNVLHMETLETRRGDSLDFMEVAVWNVREAMAQAFLAGRRRRRAGSVC